VADLLGRAHGIPAVPGRVFGTARPHVRIPFGGDSAAADALVAELGSIAADGLGAPAGGANVVVG
jgi:hypothetical protein